MWDREDDRRYENLTRELQGLLGHAPVGRAEDRVRPEDLATYLEWFELAREAAPSLQPFIDKASPYALRQLSYRQMSSDFQWLMGQMSSGSAAGV